MSTLIAEELAPEGTTSVILLNEMLDNFSLSEGRSSNHSSISSPHEDVSSFKECTADISLSEYDHHNHNNVDTSYESTLGPEYEMGIKGSQQIIDYELLYSGNSQLFVVEDSFVSLSDSEYKPLHNHISGDDCCKPGLSKCEPETITPCNHTSVPEPVIPCSHVTAPESVTPCNHTSVPEPVTPCNHVSEPEPVTPCNHTSIPEPVTPCNHVREPKPVTLCNHTNDPETVTQCNHTNGPEPVIPCNHVGDPDLVTYCNHTSEPESVTTCNHVGDPEPITPCNHISDHKPVTPCNHTSGPEPVIPCNHVGDPDLVTHCNHTSIPEPITPCNHVSEPEPVTPCNHTSDPVTVTQCNHTSVPEPVIPCNHVADHDHVTHCNHTSEPKPVATCNHVGDPEPITPCNHTSDHKPVTPCYHISESEPVTPCNHAGDPEPTTPCNHTSDPKSVTPCYHISEPEPVTPSNHAGDPEPVTPCNHTSEPEPVTSCNHINDPEPVTPCDPELVEQLLRQYLRADAGTSPWAVRRSPLGGRGVFATRALAPGELVFRDAPLVLGPRAGASCPPLCVGCHQGDVRLQVCSRGCGLPVCSTPCEAAALHRPECELLAGWRRHQGRRDAQWSPELLRAVTPIRCLALPPHKKRLLLCLQAHRYPQHAFEVEFVRREASRPLNPTEERFLERACCVLDANAFETVAPSGASLRGLYPLAAIMNHQCTPNTTHGYDELGRMVVRAAVALPAGAELTDSYTPLLWATPARRNRLEATKHFLCACARCRDPQELGARLGALRCAREGCPGTLLSLDPLRAASRWSCDECGVSVPGRQAAVVQNTLGCLLAGLDTRDPAKIALVLHRNSHVMLASNQVAVELRSGLLWLYGHCAGYSWAELSAGMLAHKEALCRELLELVNTLGTGRCRLRGLYLYELHCTLAEKQRRAGAGEYVTEALAAIQEAADIFRDDVTAPSDVWRRLEAATISVSL